ncbi:unnamed protein product [Triticum turgidum subsp. durum]|uniref:Uncharacterized protein n=1 Tax=Triticum turgidum subsp. durum TaxID=4567 RepID=A0A9R0ZZS2_TRITD|nr:unnamed protein product [Triticum turgidum subsp. durum]
MLGMIVMKHVLAMIVMNHVHVCFCFHELSVVLVEPTLADAAAAAIKLAAAKAKEDGRSNNMKWQPFMSMFVLNKMCELISSGVRTDKGFKEVHLNTVAKQVFEFYGQEVSATQVYNHLRKWRSRWIQVSKLRDLSGASWDENTCSIVLEAEHYAGHVAGGFSNEALMAALSHLLDNKAQGVGFVAMTGAHRGKLYAVFIGEVPGVYSSWEEVNAQVALYSNYNYRGFKTRQAAEQAYSAWVRKHGGGSVDSAKVGAVKVEAAKVDRQFGLKLKNFIIFAQFVTIDVSWRWCACCDRCG